MGAHIMVIDLPFIWAAIIAFAVLAYVILDGFDLGIGILFPFFPEKRDRDVMMNSVAPVWDGNETWLVLGGGGLMAVFPLAYSVILSALYAPIIAMVLGLVFRGVAFEYRWRTRRGEFLWNWAFAGGSMVAAFAQGVALGALVQGIPVANRAYAGAWWDWLTPFSIATGFAILIGYALLGSTWLIMKTTGELAEKARKIALRTCFATIAAMGIVSLWTPVSRAHLSGTVVQMADCNLQHHRADIGARLFCAAAHGYSQQARCPAVSGCTRPVRPRLCRHRHQLLSLYGATIGDHLGCGSAGFQPCLPVVGCGLPCADHPDLHWLCLLGVPRKDGSRGGLSLMPTENSVSKKLLWFVGLWFLGVLTVTIIGFAIKLSLGA
jgi:cytochrome bd-type quinol oxidase subunit 2